MGFPSVIKELENRIKELALAKIAKEAFEDKSLQAQIIDLNTQSQMYELGVDAKNQSLGEYAPITIEFYKPLAASEGRDGRTDHVTLKDTGAFYDSFEVKVEDDGAQINADTRKGATDLLTIYPHIVGLTDESINEIIPEVRELFIQAVRGRLFR